MDPAAVTRKIIHEVALDAGYGMSEPRLWNMLESWLPQPLDDALKAAIWQWVESRPEITVKPADSGGSERERTLFASTNTQWVALTGALPTDNPVSDKVFEVLSLIAHCRTEGMTTVQISKRTGQDPRLLFARVQTLVQLGLVQRFPVVEAGNGTNKMIFHECLGDQRDSRHMLDKLQLQKLILDFCAGGPQRLRLVRAINELAHESWPEIKRPRLRRIVLNAINELQQQRCLRRVAVEDPERPGSRYNCVEFLQYTPIDGGSPGIVGIVQANGLIAVTENDEEDEEDGEEDTASQELSVLKSEFDRVVSADTVDTLKPASAPEAPRVRANLVFTIVNQIYDIVKEAGSQGISAMQIHQTLTGPKYRRIVARYLEALTISKPKNALSLPHLEHLSLVKGVDFNRRVKFYRYFTKLAYDSIKNSQIPPHWGTFSDANPKNVRSLLELEIDELKQPIRLSCMLIRQNGVVKPVFHGEMNVGPDVEIILRSDSAAPRPGRPRKTPKPANTKKVEPPKRPEVVQMEQLKEKMREAVVKMDQRTWVGGADTDGEKLDRPSIYLSVQPAPALSLEATANVDSTAIIADSGPSTLKATLPAPETIGAPSSPTIAASSLPASEIPLSSFPPSSPGTPTRTQPRVGSLALQQRIDTFFAVLRQHNGVIQSGTWLTNQMQQCCQSETLIDRRTVGRMASQLLAQERIGQLTVSVPSSTGKILLKTIYYDPQSVRDPDTDERVQTLKAQLLDNSKDARSLAVRVAADLAKAAMPVRRIAQEHLDILRPPRALPGRIMGVGRSGGQVSNTVRRKYGPSAAEVLNIDANGDAQPRSKRTRKTATGAKALRSVLGTVSDAVNYHEPDSMSPVKLGPDLETLGRRVIVYKSLTPRRGSAIDWKAIIPDLGISAAEAQRQWPEARRKMGECILSGEAMLFSEVATDNTLSNAEIVAARLACFDEMLVEAYHAGLVPRPDPTNLRDEVPRLAEWWVNAERAQLEARDSAASAAETDPQLLKSQIVAKLESLKLQPRLEPHNPDPLAGLQASASVVNAERLLGDTPFSVPLFDEFSSRETRFTSAELRVRAVLAADTGPAYSAALAAQELKGLSDHETEQARCALEHKKVIQFAESDTSKVPVGRQFVLHDAVLAALSVPKTVTKRFLAAAAELKNLVLTSPLVSTVSPAIEEQQVIAVIELSCQVGPPAFNIARFGEKFGMISDDYRSRDIDKQAFECELKIEAQSLPSLPAPGTSSPLLTSPPRKANQLEPYLWQTKHLTGNAIWVSVVVKLFSLVLFRPGILLADLANSVKAALEFEETAVALQAMADAGLVDGNASEGYMASAQWCEALAQTEYEEPMAS